MAAAPAVIGAEKAARELSRVLTGDIAVIKGKIYHRREIVTYGPDLTPTGRLRKHTSEVLEPVDLEVHVNPVGIGLGALAVGGAAFAAALAWNGIKVPGPLGGEVTLLQGIKETGLGEWISDLVEEEEEPTGTAEEVCAELQARWRRLWWNPVLRRIMKVTAKEKGCAWAQ